MRTLGATGRLFTILAIVALASCTKEEPVAPGHCQDDEEVQTRALINDEGGVQPGMPVDLEAGKGDPALDLRGGGGGEEDGDGGGISDDGDEEADGERNKKDQH